MNGNGKSRKGLGGWSVYHRSSEFRTIADAALKRYNALRPFLPKCGARRKRDGEPCQNLPLRNGRCRVHGGKTPSGAAWHRPVWPDKSSPNAEGKLHKKLQALERAAKSRARRVARMEAAERARYEKWHRERPVGPPGKRAALRREREEAANARAVLSRTPAAALAADPEHQALLARIDELKALLAELDKQQAQTLEAPRPASAADMEAFG